MLMNPPSVGAMAQYLTVLLVLFLLATWAETKWRSPEGFNRKNRLK